MFVLLSKLLPLLVYPLGLACIFIILAIIFARKKRIRTASLWLAISLLWIGGNRWVSLSLTRGLETQISVPETFPSVEAIVVLGGGTESGGIPRSGVEVNGAGDRIIHAARLYRQGIAPIVILSGGNVTFLGNRPSTPAGEMRELLLFMGIPDESLVLQTESQNTYEDALFTSNILREMGINKVVLVTSASHMPRSAALFEKQGIKIIPASTDYSVPDYVWEDLWKGNFASQLINFLPNVSALSQTTSSLKEYIGIWVYGLRGWL